MEDPDLVLVGWAVDPPTGGSPCIVCLPMRQDVVEWVERRRFKVEWISPVFDDSLPTKYPLVCTICDTPFTVRAAQLRG